MGHRMRVAGPAVRRLLLFVLFRRGRGLHGVFSGGGDFTRLGCGGLGVAESKILQNLASLLVDDDRHGRFGVELVVLGAIFRNCDGKRGGQLVRVLQLLEIRSFDAANADDDGAELLMVFLDRINRLDDGGEVIICLLTENDDDGRTGLSVVLSDIAKGLALVSARERLHVEGTAVLLVGTRLDVIPAHDCAGQGRTADQDKDSCCS